MNSANYGLTKVFLASYERTSGGLIPSEQAAIKFAELIFEKYGNGQVQEQLPLRAEDRGATWFVEGTQNEKLDQAKLGPLQIEFSKRDAQVLYIGQVYSSLPIGSSEDE